MNSLFSDHAIKHRFAYVPKGKAAAYSVDGVFDFPVGSALIKTLAFVPDMQAPKVCNLNHDGPAGVNQVADWQTRGMLADLTGDVPAVPSVLPVSDRARAYLDINFAHCHKASGSASNFGLLP